MAWPRPCATKVVGSNRRAERSSAPGAAGHCAAMSGSVDRCRPLAEPLAMSPTTFREKLQRLYFGDDTRARRFRYALICFDILTIAVFLVSPLGGHQPWMIALHLAIGVRHPSAPWTM